MVNYCLRMLGAVLPRSCLICRASAHTKPLCDFCQRHLNDDLRRQASQARCYRCGLSLPCTIVQSANYPHGATLQCGSCQTNPPVFEQCIAATDYTPMAALLVNKLKHRGELSAAKLMATSLVDRLQMPTSPITKMPSALVPVPLSRQRLRQRGFNQAIEIARPLSRTLGIPMHLRACEREIDTASQQSLSVRERKANLRGSFTVLDKKSIQSLSIAIIDDVVTTGSTANALCSALLAAGAMSCEVWCFARTPAKHAQ